MLAAYVSLLENQAAPHKTHLPWTESASREAVRSAILECRRRRRIATLEEFNIPVEDVEHR